MTKEEIAQNEQFLLLPQYFQLYSIFKLSFIEIFHNIAKMISKSSAADLLYVEKGEASKINHVMSFSFFNIYPLQLELELYP